MVNLSAGQTVNLRWFRQMVVICCHVASSGHRCW